MNIIRNMTFEDKAEETIKRELEYVTFNECVFKNVQFKNFEFNNVSFNGCCFNKCTFEECFFNNVELKDCIIENASYISKCFYFRSNIKNTNIFSLSVLDSVFKRTQFRNNKVYLLEFSNNFCNNFFIISNFFNGVSSMLNDFRGTFFQKNDRRRNFKCMSNFYDPSTDFSDEDLTAIKTNYDNKYDQSCYCYASFGQNVKGKNKLCGSICPAEGSFIGYKKCRYLDELNNIKDCIVTLKVSSDAKRIGDKRTGKCRCSKAEVVKIEPLGSSENVTKAFSFYDENFEYGLNEKIIPDDFNDAESVTCTNGIHFFMTKEKAINFDVSFY